MLTLDRVFCDSCGNYVGQLFSAAAQSPELVDDKNKPPHLCLCPDCRADLVIAESEAA